MGQHKTATRYLTGLMSVYHDLAAGRTEHARARVALLIGATHQHVIDEGNWDPAWHITGLPRPAFHEFAAQPKRDPKNFSSEDDILACTVDPRRALTARQIRADALLNR